MIYLRELSDYLGGLVSRYRTGRDFSSVLHMEVAQDIAADALRTARALADKGHQAEVHALEALNAIDEAQAPDSAGGACITPTEAERIKSLIRRAASDSHDISEQAYV